MSERIKAILFIAIGIAALVGSVVTAGFTVRFMRESQVAPGVVEMLNAGGSHPQIGFTTAGGERISYPQGGMTGGWKPGDRMNVRYRPEEPGGSATIDATLPIWDVPLCLLVFGGIFFLIGYANRHG